MCKDDNDVRYDADGDSDMEEGDDEEEMEEESKEDDSSDVFSLGEGKGLKKKKFEEDDDMSLGSDFMRKLGLDDYGEDLEEELDQGFFSHEVLELFCVVV